MKTQDYLVEAAKATPPVGILGAQFLGYTLTEWTALVAFILVVFQLVILVRKEVYLPLKEKYVRQA